MTTYVRLFIDMFIGGFVWLVSREDTLLCSHRSIFMWSFEKARNDQINRNVILYLQGSQRAVEISL